MASGVITAIVLLLTVIQAAMCNVIAPDPRNFFPDVKNNLTKIVWAHAVNSKAELEAALSSGKVMMLEADVVLGKLNETGNSSVTPDIPIMAHPPSAESDLSLDEFLSSNVRNNGTKGIKLDFKTIQAFEQSKSILTKWRPELKFPVFINADILTGPVNATNTTPVNANDFLKGAKEIVPECIISVGWTTRYGKEFNITEGQYTSEQIRMMTDVVAENHITQPITYPVRAGLAANDIDTVKMLLKNATSNATLTIWSSKGDNVNVAQLNKLIRDVGIDKIYVDVPEELKKKLDLSAASALDSAAIMTVGTTLAVLALARML